MNRGKYGLKAQSLLALLISLIAAILTFCLADAVSSVILNNFFEHSTYIDKESTQYMDRFEAFVKQNNVKATDDTLIDGWINTHKTALTIIYINRDGATIYDSLRFNWNSFSSPESNKINDSALSDAIVQGEYYGGNYSDNSWFLKREIVFSDGVATVSLYGYFYEWLYHIVLITEIILACAAFCIVFVCLIRRKINYVIQLEQEVRVLETGGLDFPVTVKGKDELSSLADSLNQMRLALSENMKTEAAAVKANYDLVVAVSHDLRTPLTSLALYLDLIHAEKYDSPDQLNSYLEKSRSKVSQIKQMTDQLFEKFYLEKDRKILEEPEFVQNIFEDYLSNMTGYLDVNGFKVCADINWTVQKASVSTDYINRILDNISSNILKYADPSFPVLLTVKESDGMLLLQFVNHILYLEAKPDSKEVGVENIHFMINKMNGKCKVSQINGNYSIQLLFPYYDENGASNENEIMKKEQQSQV